jgi:hypothetical protein
MTRHVGVPSIQRFEDSHDIDGFVTYGCLDTHTDRHDEARRSAQQIRFEDSIDVDRFVTYRCHTDRHFFCRSSQQIRSLVFPLVHITY